MKFWQNFMKDGRGLKLFHEGQKRDRQAGFLSEQPFQKVEPKKRNKPLLQGSKAPSQKRASNLQDRSAPLQKRTRKDDRVADELLQFAVYVQKFNGSDIVPITESEWQKVLDGLLNAFCLNLLR